MEHLLRCNSLKCRKELNDQAVVTTCSHIFCLDCSSRLRLSNPPQGQHPVCPACETHLVNLDDAVVTNLNPTEDYKTSVLSGLSPNVIMECTGRALSFWAYQTTQEIVYQEFLARSLTEKYNNLNSQMDKMIHDGNNEISALRERMENMTIAQESLQRKNGELLQAYREKSRKYNQTQELYDKLKRRVMLGQVQSAASDAVDNIEASAVSSRFIDQPGNLERQSAKPLVFPGPQGATMVQARLREEEILRSMMPPAARAAFSSQDGIDSTQTPSSHRQRLPSGTNPGIGFASLQNSNSISTPLPQRRVTSARQPLARLSPNANLGIGLSGYGISAGAKISHPPAAVQRNSSAYRPGIRSRVAQRPASAFVGDPPQTHEEMPVFDAFGQESGHR